VMIVPGGVAVCSQFGVFAFLAFFSLQRFMPPRGFQVLPRRWVVERTIAWIDHNRRMSKDYERLTESAEAFIYVAMSRLMLRRLARS
jgi:transposase